MRKGFTLLEMLVVVGIIAILVSMGIASYSTAQRKARDAKRRSDLTSIRNAFEQYYSLCTYKYPSTIPAAGSNLTATTAECTSLAADVVILKMPSDPLGGNYTAPVISTSGYTICPKDIGSGKYLETEDCNTTNLSCCVSNQQ
jgi:prepilin-type N-terminal cleavage/methylation domain-containing protein